ncbi:hypothetical protein HPB52_002669 [Rhipicephalus sanguineus]|uniref:Palmitoyltransferase n=1 Tax=Rhipicephalus sanguineus TaxID=34632 RepID=A0A9D4PCS0_RHISA|nr:hypothetical protein HPB52_002669 [Rhipicephalus sanguineus]
MIHKLRQFDLTDQVDTSSLRKLIVGGSFLALSVRRSFAQELRLEGLIQGDLGYYSSDGRIFVCGRLKELIKCMDQQVAPAELEELLAADQGVRQVIVVGVPHEQYGEAPRAFVVPRRRLQLEEQQREAEKLKKLVSGSLLGTVIRAVQSICLWVPVVFAVSLFAEAYYAYVFVFCGLFVKENALCFALATVFHLLLFFCLWSFAQTTFTSPARVPPYFHISEDERRNLAHAVRNPTRRAALLEAMAAKRGVLTRAADGSVNYCDPCQRIKPDRCHHCSSCERCILKMDHHCPWFNNCVCYNTYKFFLLTLFYIELLCVYVFFSVSVYVWKRKHHQLLQSMHTVFLVTLGASSFLSIGSFLCLHLTLLSRNCTTLESSRPPNFKERGDSFDLGTPRNFTEVRLRRNGSYHSRP